MTQNNRPYVLWRRVSTKAQGDSGLGLKAQVAIAEYFMKHKADKVFTDVYTGTKLSECRNLWKAVEYCKDNGLLLVIAKTDRFREVKEALTVLDETGEGNLMFCDLPTTDRTVLTIVFALWERQAIQGRINTKVALAERQKLAAKGESWISKSGRECTRLGRPADYIDENGKERYDLSAAIEAAGRAKQDAAISWREQSKGYKWVRTQLTKGKSRTLIIEEFNELHAADPENYSTREGKPLSKGVLSKWCREMNPLAV